MIEFTNDDVDVFARIWHAQKFRSRRQAKRMIREAGGRGDAAELDEILQLIRNHDRFPEIVDRAEAIEAARMEQQRREALAKSNADIPEWLIAETSEWGRTFIIHICPGGSQGFIGEIFDDADEAPEGLERYPLDDGQVLGNITWMDGERPPDEVVLELMATAQRELRVYDSQELHGGTNDASDDDDT